MSASLLHRVGWFLRELLRRGHVAQCPQLAASLAFTSLLALVPLLVVGFATLSLFPAFEAWQDTLQNFIFKSFVPGMGDLVQQHLLSFAAKARALQGLGVAALVVTVLSLMANIETAFNDLWEVRHRRPLGKRLLLYWVLLTLGPLLVGVGLVATSFVVSLPWLRRAGEIPQITTVGLQLLPLLATWAAFALAYKAIPYRRIRLSHAVLGGLVGALLFEISKHLFAIWLTNFPTQQAIYGAFATVPVFLLWVYLCWFIVLGGAVFTRCLEAFPIGVGKLPTSAWQASSCYLVWRLLVCLHDAQRRGDALTEAMLLAREPALDASTLADSLRVLSDARWVARDEDFAWLLSRDLDDLRLVDLLRLVPAPLSALDDPADLSAEDQRVYALVAHQHQQLEASLGVSLASLMNAVAPA